VVDPPAEDVTVIDDDGTVVFTTSVPVASKAPNGCVGRLVLAERVGFREPSLEVACMARTPLASSKCALVTVTSSTKLLSLTTGMEFGADAVTRTNAGRVVGSVGRIDAKNRPEMASLVIVVVGIPSPVAIKVASPDERAKILTFAVAGAVLE
jgi:hypothetical protein